MANSKISALTSASTVVGTEVLPIVQSSATVKVAISDLNPGLSTITAVKGGTGQTSYAVGDLLYANTTTTLAKLADVATGNALISGGVSTAPSYGKIGLTTHVSGTLPVANGGTNATTASITSFNNITGYTASGATGTTSTNLVFSTSPTLVTPALGTPSALVGTNITGTANSLNAGLGVNQTWQGVTRAIGTTYTNSTGKPITAAVSYTCTNANTVQGLIISGATVYAGAVNVATFAGGFSLIIPDGATYVTTTNAGTLTLVAWAELR